MGDLGSAMLCAASSLPSASPHFREIASAPLGSGEQTSPKTIRAIRG